MFSLRPSLLLLLLMFLWVPIWVPVRGYGNEEGELCGLNGCQAIDLAKRHTDLTMAKMMHTIKPEALEEVFQNMAKLELLVREVQDLQRDTRSLYQPGVCVRECVRDLNFLYTTNNWDHKLGFTMYIQSLTSILYVFSLPIVIVVWPVNHGPQRWSMCAEGPCSCTLETRFVSCWRLELLDHVPRKQQIPGDTRSL